MLKKVDEDKIYTREETLSLLDKNGNFKDKLCIYDIDRENRSIDGMKPTDPPIYNKTGATVSKDGRSCSGSPKHYTIDNKSYNVIRECPNASEGNWEGRTVLGVILQMLYDDISK